MGAGSETVASTAEHRTTADHLRGSSLLTAGRLLSVGLNFLVQVLIARYLSRSDFGAFAYALSLVTLAETVSTFGLDRGTSRFLAMYDERHDYARVLGTLVFVLGTIASLGLAVVLAVVGLSGWLAGQVLDDRAAVSLLVILIVLAPLQALDNVLGGVLAVFGSARSIFVRRYVLAPGFRLVVVGLLVLGEQDVTFLAAGYVVAGAVGLLLYGGILWRVLGARGIRSRLSLRRDAVPVKEILAFTVPLLSTDLVYVCMTSVDVLLLGHLHGASAVADLRVIQPLVNLNLIVYASFAILFTPVASRMYAREDRDGVRDLYWSTAVWVAVLSFPMFALTAMAAGPVTELLFGERYAGSAQFLVLLAIAQYVNAAFGYNGLTLRVFGLVRYTLLTNLATVVLNLVLLGLLVPALGALGAAIATAATLVVHNVLKQLGLRRTGVDVFDSSRTRVYTVIVTVGAALGAVHLLTRPPAVISLALVAVASAAVLLLNRQALDVAGTFPQVRRIPLVGRLLAG